MTSGSGLRPGARRVAGEPVVFSGVRPLLLPWLAGCMMIGTGCVYVLPLPYPEPNQPPEVIEPIENPKTVVLRGPAVSLMVMATDPEGAPVIFEWPDLLNVEHSFERFQDGDFWVGIVRIPDGSDVASSTVRALVHDGDRDNLVTLRFEVVQP